MSETLPACPMCKESYTYDNGVRLACPMCGHEWLQAEPADDGVSADSAITDAFGNVLADGDTVVVVKDLKIKGAGGGVVKVGTKVRGIRLITDGVADHDIDAKVPGFGRMQLKSSVVKKSG